MIQFLFYLLRWLIQSVQPFIVPLCFVLAWSILLLALWSVWSAARDGVAQASQMHKIPCANCQFFTGDYRLKCPVRPTIALSEDAIDCSDYEPVSNAGSLMRY